MGRRRSTGRRAPSVLAAMLVAALAAGCSPPAEIALGAAPAAAAKVSVASPDKTGFVPFHTWPQACDMLVEPDVRAVLPAVTKVESSPKGLEMTNFDLDSPQRIISVTGALCTVDVWLAGALDETEKATSLEVRIRMAGTTKLARANYDRFVKLARTCPAGAATIRLDACSRNGSAYAILKDGIAIEFSGYRPTLAEDVRYQGQKGDDDATVWEDRVMPELLKAIAAKLP